MVDARWAPSRSQSQGSLTLRAKEPSDATDLEFGALVGSLKREPTELLCWGLRFLLGWYNAGVEFL